MREKTSAEPPLSLSSKDAPYTLNHTTHSALTQNKSRRYTNSVYFNAVTLSGKTDKRHFEITTSKISLTLMEPQLLLCIPACGYKFYVLSVHPQPTFTNIQQDAFAIQFSICGRTFFAKIINVFKPLATFAEEFQRDCLAGF